MFLKFEFLQKLINIIYTYIYNIILITCFLICQSELVRITTEEQVWASDHVQSYGPDSGLRIIEHGAIERET